MDKIRVIEGSLRCHVWGWLSLIPLLGLPAGVIAVVEYQMIARQSRGQWNAARNYLKAGLLLGIFGILLSGGLGLLLAAYILSKIANGSLSLVDLMG